MRLSRYSTLLTLAFAILLAPSLRAAEPPAYRQTPAFYERIKDQLTPIESVMDGATHFKDTKKSAIYLLNERFEYVDEDDTRYTVYHNISYVKDKAGIDAVAKDVFSHRKNGEEIYLVSARTIQPSGDAMEPADNAVFIQSPQSEADANLYSDYDELVVIYPKVEVGSITEHIVITREAKPIVPHEFNVSLYFQRWYPTYRARYVIDLPESYANRIRFSHWGSGIPSRQETKANGRVTWTYLDEPKSGYAWEAGREPISDTGPVERLSTFASWDAVNDWLAPLVAERNKLSDELMATIDGWTDGLTDRNEIVQAIFDRIANDVRYTGLEFGLAGYQPYDCNVVWKNKYGDCKDKANLLAAALNYKGIPANICLIDTDSLGKFDESSPNPFYFNHAITAVQNEDGSYLFLDPTVENLKIGDLPPSDANRTTLIIGKPTAELARTPAISSGDLRFEFDLEIDSQLTLSGWFSMYGDGYYASWYKTFLEDKSDEALRWDMHERVQNYYPGAECIDVVFNPEYGPDTPIMKAYFSLKNESGKSGETYSLALPNLTWTIPDVGDLTGSRSTQFAIDKSVSEILVKVRTPSGLAPGPLPQDFNTSNPSYQYTGQWRSEPYGVSARIVLTQRTDRIDQGAFSDFHATVTSMRRWWQTPLAFSTSGAIGPSRNENEMPKLATAKGQLALIDERWDMDEHPVQRRAALVTFLEWFPTARFERFEATMEIARLDDGKVPAGELAKFIESALSEYDKDIDPIYKAWGEFLLAQQLEEINRDSEALKYYVAHTNQSNLSPFRVGWAAYRAGLILKKRGSAQLDEVLRRGMADDSDALNDLAYLLVSAHADKADAKAIGKDFDTLEKKYPQKFKEIVDYVSSGIESGDDISSPKAMSAWRAALEKLCKKRSDLSDNLASLDRIESKLTLRQQIPGISKKIAALLRKTKLDWYTANEPKGKVTSDQLASDIESTETSSKYERQATLCLAFLARYPDDVDRFTKYLNWAVWNLTYHVKGPEIQEFLRETILQLQPANESLADAYINMGKHLRRERRFDEARALMESLLAFNGLSPSYRGISYVRYAQILEDQGNKKEAIDNYLKGGAYHFDNYRTFEGVLRAFFLAQAIGDRASVDKCLEIFAAADSKALDQSDSGNQIRRILRVSQNQSYRDRYYKLAETARKELTSIALKIGITNADLPDSLPLIDDYDELSENIIELSKSDLDGFHAKIIFLAMAGLVSEDDLLLASQRLVGAKKTDGATLGIHRSIIPLLKLAATSGAYANRELLQINYIMGMVNTDARPELSAHARELISSASSSERLKDFAALMWSSALVGKKDTYQDAIAELRLRLEKSGFAEWRAEAVNLVAAVLVEEKRFLEARRFIETEIKNSVVSANEPVKKNLNSYLDQISKEQAVADNLALVIREWRESLGLSWWDHIKPLAVADLYQLNGDTEPADEIFPIESVKHYLLLAEQSEEPIDVKNNALVSGFANWLYTVPNPEKAIEAASQLISDSRLDTTLRNKLKIILAYYQTNRNFPDPLRETLANDDFIAPEYRKGFHDVLEFLGQSQSTKEETLSALRKLISGGVDDFDVTKLHATITSATVRFGGAFLAPFLDDLTKAKTGANVQLTPAQLRLRMAQSVRLADSLQPIYQSIVELVEANVELGEPLPYIADPASIDPDLFPRYLPTFIERFGYTESPLAACGEVLGYLHNVRKVDISPTVEKIYAAIRDGGPSSIANELFHAVAMGIDIDEPSHRTAFFENVRAYLQKYDNDALADQFNYWYFFIGPQDPEWTGRLGDGFVLNQGTATNRNIFNLALAYQQGKTDEAASMLATIPPDALESLAYAYSLYDIADGLGDTMLSGLLADQAKRVTSEGALMSLSTGNLKVDPVLDYVLRFPQEANEVRWYLDYIVSHSENRVEIARAKAILAYLDSDWDTVIAQIEESERFYPAFWDLRLFTGIAEFERGNLAAAREDLLTYRRYRAASPCRSIADDYLARIEDAETKIAVSPDKASDDGA